jgi:hypothetical protein
MLWGKKVLRISAAVAVAAVAAHTAESHKGQTAQQPLLLSIAQGNDTRETQEHIPTAGAIPTSASLSGSGATGLGDLVGITSVAATTPAAGGDHCRPSLQLTALSGAMIHMAMSAPCNRNERVVVRHSGLSFATKTEPDGTVRAVLPALKTDATVAVYLADTHLVLGNILVPDASDFTRLALMWEWPAEVELRVTEGERVLVGTPAALNGISQQVMSLGSTEVQSPLMANVYSVPGSSLGAASLTGELRITPASCGRTLQIETVYSADGVAKVDRRNVAVPLCGTAGDILQLKNLAPTVTLSPPK